MIVPSLTWNVLRHVLHNVKQHRCMCTVTSLYEEKGKWLPQLQRENMLEIEKIWKSKVQAENDTRLQSQTDTEESRTKFYVLSMFPYPSGKLHMGHVRVYTISDTMARYHRMLGHNVIHPMGWDAFGLPAENAARERNLHPREWTYSNIALMKQQLTNLCCSFDWDRELTTCDPSYYKWTQYIFLKMHEAGLTYQKYASVNWDPVDQTVLADEQIDENGRSWRSGALAVKKYLRQWYIKTTAYSKALYDGLDTVNSDMWGDVIDIQKFWIGECTGCRVELTVMEDGEEREEKVSVFTEIPECIYGVSYLMMDPSERLNDEKYYKEVKKHPVTGKDVVLLNIQAVHPLSGQLLPIVVSEIRQPQPVRKISALLGIPCESEEDQQIADLFGLSWQQVIKQDIEKEALVNSGQFDGLERRKAKEAVMAKLKERGHGGYQASQLLNDWLISRQRYWGTPIPIIHCDTCKTVPVPYEDLPVVLPDNIDVSHKGEGSPLQYCEDWINVKCPKCGGNAKRETDTMDTFLDSSWYFLRYLDPNNQSEPVSSSLANKYMPVDLYIGGKEHAHLHLFFARFFNYFLHNIGVLQQKEPFVDLLTQGMVKGESFRIKKTGHYIPPSEAQKIDNRYVQKGTNEPLEVKFEKMSKSKLNGVDPEELFEMYGVDLTRLCILTNVAPRTDRNWNTVVYDGVQKWLNRVWYVTGVLVNRSHVTSLPTDDQVQEWNQKIRKCRNDYLIEINQQINTGFTLNVVIARLQEFTSDLRIFTSNLDMLIAKGEHVQEVLKVPAEVAVNSSEYERSVVDLALLMAPLSPMFSSELWSALSKVVTKREQYDFNKSIHEQRWPEVDPDALIPILVTLPMFYLGHVYIQQKDVNSLTAESLLSLAREEKFYQEIVKNHPVTYQCIKVAKTGLPMLVIEVPAIEQDVIKLKREFKKQKKSKKNEKKASQTEAS